MTIRRPGSAMLSIGTKSVLFGAHQFLIHPLFVALAWLRLYGFSRVEDRYVGRVSILNPLLWVAFFVHDVGYLGKPNMDGEEGERHPETGALIIEKIADFFWPGFQGQEWHWFVRYHSRFLARRDDVPYSLLCVADKLAVAMEPWWFYLPRVIASGEVEEYMGLRKQAGSKYSRKDRRGRERGSTVTNPHPEGSRRHWFYGMAFYCRAWAYTHRDGREDDWTPTLTQNREAA